VHGMDRMDGINGIAGADGVDGSDGLYVRGVGIDGSNLVPFIPIQTTSHITHGSLMRELISRC
jgi:hypothetical protein